MVDKLISFIRGFIFSRRTHMVILVALVLMPVLFFARESCKDGGQIAAMIPEASCTYLIETKPVTNTTLLTFTQLFILIILASNWNLTGGFTGYIDFGHAVFFGIGAFATANLMGASRWEEYPAMFADWNFWPAMLTGGLIASLFAMMIGSATLRLKGPYFSIAMLGTLVAVREIVRVSANFSGGGLGMNLPVYVNRPMFYYLFLVLTVLVITFISWLRKTEFGATLVAIREDEVGAEMRGINTTLHKIAAFCTAAFLTGSVGGIWAYQNTFIDADIAFQQTRTIDMVMMSMLGGLGTVAGPVLGSTVMFWLRDVVWSNFLLYHQIFEGLLLIAIVLFVPEGIMGMFDQDGEGASLNEIVKGWFQKSPQNEEESQ